MIVTITCNVAERDSKLYTVHFTLQRERGSFHRGAEPERQPLSASDPTSSSHTRVIYPCVKTHVSPRRMKSET